MPDVDDIEDDLDAPEDEADLAFWSERQKELVTAQVDYNLGTLKDLAEGNTIDLKPHFQRRNRWGEDKNSKLIESLLLNVPIPPVYLNEDKFGKYSVIDGKQRITAVVDFLSGRYSLKKLKIFSDLNGLYFANLPGPIQTIMRTRPTLRAVIVLRQSDPAIKYEVFQRLNTGGVALNPQEIRNNVFTGALNTRINEIGESVEFHKVLGITKKEESKIYKEMRDSELVLRFMTFADTWETFSGGVRLQMDAFMEKHKNAKKQEVAQLETKFNAALGNVVSVFGTNAFKRWLPDKGLWRNQVLASLYDAQMLGMQEFSGEQLEGKKDLIREGFKVLFNDQQFFRSIDSATNTPSYLKLRVTKVRDMVRKLV